jgi:hypothetical protein
MARPGVGSGQLRRDRRLHGIDAPAKADSAVDLDDRHAVVKALAQRWIAVDIYQPQPKAVGLEQLASVITKMAAATRVEHNVYFNTISLGRASADAFDSDAREPLF